MLEIKERAQTSLEDSKVDVKENCILKISDELLKILLKDRTTNENIVWATKNYTDRGNGFGEKDHITINNITGKNGNVIKPRIEKSKATQIARIKENAEVFTPSWVCNNQNNLVDNIWFNGKDIFNKETSNSWKTVKRHIPFKNGRTWQEYLLQKRLEITCGEAPYLVSRYDTTTGNMIPIQNRIGLLDRKLRVLNENVKSEKEWVKWAKIAYQNTYGYEYQGDSLLLARENLLLTFADYYYYKFSVAPILEYLLEIAEIISWNIWQMDGLTGYIPFVYKDDIWEQLDLFEPPTKAIIPIPSKIINWNNKQVLEYQKIKGDNNMHFDVIIGNPPYQETKGKTKNIDIWPLFIRQAVSIADDVVLIHPGRWIVPKTQMRSIQEMILNAGLLKFDYFPNASILFNNVLIDGGVSITYFKRDYHDKIKYFNNNQYFGIFNPNEIFFSDKFEKEAFSKINSNKKESIQKRILGNIGSLGGSEFGYSKVKHLKYLKKENLGIKTPIKVWANSSFGKGSRFSWHYIDKDKLLKIPQELLEKRKIIIDKKGHAITGGKGNIINNIPMIVEKNAVASGDVFFVIPEIDTDYHLQLIKSLFLTKTCRFLMSITQKDLYVRGFENIPDYTNFIPNLNGQLFSDEWFYQTFNFSKELIEHIENCISSKDERPYREME